MLGNIKKGIITTIFGILFLLATLVYLVFPMFKEGFDSDSIIILSGAAIGIGLLLSPDDLFKKLKDKI